LEQFANDLERHLLGTEGPWDWDDKICVEVADKELEALRCKLQKFASLNLEKDKEELREIIAALRRGEIPEVNPD